MVAIIKYAEIQNKVPSEVLKRILEEPKKKFEELKVEDIIHSKLLNECVCNITYHEIYVRGVYLVFDPEGAIVYVGQTKTGFYGRFMSHFNPTPRPGWGWNALLSKMAARRLGEQAPKDYKPEVRRLRKHRLLLISAANSELDDKELRELERIFKKAYKEGAGNQYLNTATGKLSPEQRSNPIGQSIKKWRSTR